MVFTLQTEAYGSHASQQGDLYLPDCNPRAVICLLHGGFWRMPYGRDQLGPLARVLCSCGFAIWNLEYRRIGDDGGWPNTFLDVAAGLDHLAKRKDLPLDEVIVAGHSAGGHLALWAAKRDGFPGVQTPIIRPKLVIGLAPIADLKSGSGLHLGSGAIQSLIGAEAANQSADRYRLGSPYNMIPLGVRQVIIHGEEDSFVPITLSEGYVEAARSAGDDVEFIRLANCGHMEFLDPESEAIQVLRMSFERRAAF